MVEVKPAKFEAELITFTTYDKNLFRPCAICLAPLVAYRTCIILACLQYDDETRIHNS